MKIATAGEMARIDRCAAGSHGIAVAQLMERAGRCTADAARLLLGSAQGRRVAVYCGRGNNGGDGFVAARLLREGGASVRAVIVGSPERLSADAGRACDAARNAGVEILPCADLPSLAAAASPPDDLIIDALFGTGFSPPARGLEQAAIRLINSLGRPVLAVDVPSGLAADGGPLCGEAVQAAATVTFGYPKPGLVQHPGARFVGRLWLADIGFPPATDSLVAGDLRLTTPADLASFLAARDPEAHKGTFGHVLLVAGSPGMFGAAALAALGALRAGAGLVTAALSGSPAPPLLPDLPEAMVMALPDRGPAARPGRAASLVIERLPRVGALAVGPGLSRSDAAARLVRELCEAASVPLVLDADALHALAGGGGESLRRRSSPAVLTPHPGELSLLIGSTTGEVQSDRVGSARACATRYGAVVVLKGSRTVVAPPLGPAWINPTGDPAMAAAGMGDVLAGAIAAHLARGMAPLDAALLGAYLHGRAGEIVVAEVGPWGILASEVADRLPAAVRSLWSPAHAPAGNLSLLVG